MNFLMRLLAILIIVNQSLCAYIATPSEYSYDLNISLKEEIFSMYHQDQMARWAQIDTSFCSRLKEIVTEYGWPGISLVGEGAASAFWLLVHHTDDIHFQRECLYFLESAVLNKEANPLHLAYLEDWILIHEGKFQKYGTQLDWDWSPFPIEEELYVDERRASIGLSSLQQYIEMCRQMHNS